MRSEIPAKTIKTCDACGVEDSGHNFRHGCVLKLERAALDWHNAPVADASIRRDLCDTCQYKVSIAINEAMGGSAPSIPTNAICLFMDGNKTCAVFGDFVNLQESPAGFGDNFEEAIEALRGLRLPNAHGSVTG